MWIIAIGIWVIVFIFEKKSNVTNKGITTSTAIDKDNDIGYSSFKSKEKPSFPFEKIHKEESAPQKLKIAPVLEDKISHFGFYHPYNNGQNPKFDRFSGRILDFKEDKTGSVDYFFRQLKDVDFNATEAIVIVPSHSPQNRMSSVKKLAQKLAQYKGWVDATDCVVRTYLIDKLANGGDRSLDVHLGSLNVVNEHLIAGKNVLVLDDVTTSGNSLFATMRLLKEKNVNSVWSYAIARTE